MALSKRFGYPSPPPPHFLRFWHTLSRSARSVPTPDLDTLFTRFFSRAFGTAANGSDPPPPPPPRAALPLTRYPLIFVTYKPFFTAGFIVHYENLSFESVPNTLNHECPLLNTFELSCLGKIPHPPLCHYIARARHRRSYTQVRGVDPGGGGGGKHIVLPPPPQ